MFVFKKQWSTTYLSAKIRVFNFQVIRTYTVNKKNRIGEGVCVFVNESLSLKLRQDLIINCDAIQSLSIEIPSTKSKNIILNTIHRPPNGDMKQCETHFKDIF